jgi:hypothetical protein
VRPSGVGAPTGKVQANSIVTLQVDGRGGAPAPVSSTNEVCFTPSAATHVIADVAGYFSSRKISYYDDVYV